jgi:hypothetical protein
MSFIVTSDGRVAEPKILTSVSEEYDKGIVNELLKTSKRWTPAMLRGEPVHTLVFFEIKFLDSLNR